MLLTQNPISCVVFYYLIKIFCILYAYNLDPFRLSAII